MRAGAGMAGLKEDVEDVMKKFQRSLAVLRTMETVIVLTIRSNDKGINDLDDSSRIEDDQNKNGSNSKRLQQQDLQYQLSRILSTVKSRLVPQVAAISPIVPRTLRVLYRMKQAQSYPCCLWRLYD